MTTPLDLDAMRARDRAFGDGESEDTDSIAADRHALLAHCAALAAEVERLRAALAVSEQATAPTRGSLINALASAGAARVEAEARLARAEVAYKHQPHAAQREALAAAQVAVGVAHAEEQKARAALDAWESADREADPCPGSRGF